MSKTSWRHELSSRYYRDESSAVLLVTVTKFCSGTNDWNRTHSTTIMFWPEFFRLWYKFVLIEDLRTGMNRLKIKSKFINTAYVLLDTMQRKCYRHLIYSDVHATIKISYDSVPLSACLNTRVPVTVYRRPYSQFCVECWIQTYVSIFHSSSLESSVSSRQKRFAPILSYRRYVLPFLYRDVATSVTLMFLTLLTYNDFFPGITNIKCMRTTKTMV
jgi:hypothetical protein